MEGCGLKTAKVLMFIFNFIFWISGLILLILGIMLIVDANSVYNMGEAIKVDFSAFQNSAYILIFVGALAFVIGGFGCCGAVKENTCCLYMFSISIILLLILELVGGILIVVYKDELDRVFTAAFKEVSNSYDPKVKSDVPAIENLYTIQKSYLCCGGESYLDYQGSKIEASFKKPQKIPESCCETYKETPQWKPCINMDPNFWQNTRLGVHILGCGHKVADSLKELGNPLSIIALIICACEIIGVVFACCLIKGIKEYERVA